jgi:hypothetical protein
LSSRDVAAADQFERAVSAHLAEDARAELAVQQAAAPEQPELVEDGRLTAVEGFAATVAVLQEEVAPITKAAKGMPLAMRMQMLLRVPVDKAQGMAHARLTVRPRRPRPRGAGRPRARVLASASSRGGDSGDSDGSGSSQGEDPEPPEPPPPVAAPDYAALDALRRAWADAAWRAHMRDVARRQARRGMTGMTGITGCTGFTGITGLAPAYMTERAIRSPMARSVTSAPIRKEALP